VWRVSWTRMRRTPALAHRAWKLRLKLRGSIGVPQRVVNTKPKSCQTAPATSLAWSCSSWRRLSAVRQISGNGKMAADPSVLVSECRSSAADPLQLPGEVQLGGGRSHVVPCQAQHFAAAKAEH